VLKVADLRGGYGRSQVLFGISLEVPHPSIVAILGRNGAGKTTLLQHVMGYLKPTAGRLSYEGADITGLSPQRTVRAGIGYVPQERNIFARLTVRENLAIGAARSSRAEAATQEVLDLFPILGRRLAQKAGSLSGGERKMLAIARALLGDPSLLLLDEPTEGVWHGVVAEIEQRLAELARTRSILIVEQHVELALRLADSVYVLDRGNVVLSGTPADVAEDPRLYRYLSL
jgi:branched-chain amino acid transport system ATP-binding protein